MTFLRGLIDFDTFKKDKINWLLFVGLVIVIPILEKRNQQALLLMRQDMEQAHANQDKACLEMKNSLKEALKDYKIELNHAINMIKTKDSIIVIQNERLRTQKKILN